MISYTIPSANYRHPFAKGALSDHVDVEVVPDDGTGRYTAKLTLHPRSTGVGKRAKTKLSHVFLKVWITVPPGELLADECEPKETGARWTTVHGRTAFWMVRRVNVSKKGVVSFSAPFTPNGTKGVRLDFGLHSDELKMPVALQADLEALMPQQSQGAQPKAASTPRRAEGGLAAGAGA